MNHALRTMMALVLGAGLAATAQAHGIHARNATPTQHRTAMRAMPTMGMHQQLSKNQVKQAQRALKSDGFYRGKIDGKMGPKTKQAVAKFQRKEGLSQTARLDRSTLMRLTNAGVGSSMPKTGKTRLNNAGANNYSGSSLNNNMRPAPSAGGDTGNTINQNPTNK
ncbi:MAG: peptidoglycan-binding domain-containing protein [Thiohalocapsa sp.]